MANHVCRITDAEAGVLTDPSLDPNFINQAYEEPVKNLKPNLNISIYVGDTAYEFNRHYIAGSGEGEGVYGSRGLAGFIIADTDRKKFNLPFMPVKYQRVVISDELGEIFTGYIQNIRRETLGYRSDGTALQFLTIECEDPWGLLEQETYNEFYSGKKVGYVVRDAFQRAGFDVSEIDPELGPTFPDYAVIELYPADVINYALGYIDYTFWIDRVTLKPYVFPRDAVQAELFRVDESNWTKLFDELDIEEDETGFANEILVTFLEKYSQGTANFEQDQDVVLGYSGNEGWVHLPPNQPLSIENNLTGAIYRINLNNSEDEETNELILESLYKEDTSGGQGTNVPYTITGHKNKVKVRNSTSQQQIKALRGGTGRIVRKIVLDNVALFKSEAKTVAKAELAIASRQLYIGSGKTISQKLGILLSRSGPQEGRTIYFDLPFTKGIQAALRIESFRWKDNSTKNERLDGTVLQGLDYTMDFTPSVTREQLRELSKKLTVTGVTTTDEYIQDIEGFSNIVALKNCLHVVEPIKAADKNIVELEDSLNVREVVTKTYYFAPADTHPDDQAHFVGPTKYSNFS